MTKPDKVYSVDDEITEHKTQINKWIISVSTMKVCEGRKQVNNRFIRDCQTLLSDLDAQEIVSSDDLCDFVDSRNSLESRFVAIEQETQ